MKDKDAKFDIHKVIEHHNSKYVDLYMFYSHGKDKMVLDVLNGEKKMEASLIKSKPDMSRHTQFWDILHLKKL